MITNGGMGEMKIDFQHFRNFLNRQIERNRIFENNSHALEMRT